MFFSPSDFKPQVASGAVGGGKKGFLGVSKVSHDEWATAFNGQQPH